MTLSIDLEALMLAYVYGELDGDAARAFEARMADDAVLRAEVEGLLATRDLLAVDARHGEESGFDVPPAHLVDAILRAEPLARPAQIRDASLALERQGGHDGAQGWVHKISTWLLGGGVVATAAAALLVLVSRDDALEPPTAQVDQIAGLLEPAPEAAPASKATSAFEEGAAAERKAEVAAPFSSPSSGRDPDDLGFGLADEVAEAEAEPKTRGGSSSSERRARRKRSGAGPPPSTASLSKDLLRAEASPDAEVPATPADKRAEWPPTPAKEAAAKNDLVDGFEDGSGLAQGAPAGAARPLASMAAPAEAAPSAPVRAAPSAPLSPEPPPLPPAVKKKAEEHRRKLAKGRAAAAPRAQATLEAERQKAVGEAEMALASAALSLREGRADEALDLFQRAALFDRQARVLGAAPYVGQMQAYLALRRPAEALALFPVVRRHATSDPDRAQGALAAGQAAERLGRAEEARRYYREAARHPSTKKAATSALARLSATGDRAAGASAAEADAEPAAESEPETR